MSLGREDRMAHLDKTYPGLSIKRQCDALSLNRSSLYYEAKDPSGEDETLLNQIRDIWEKWPFYGYRRIHITLIKQGLSVNRKRVQRLMKEAGIQAIYPRPNTSANIKDHRKYPYALRDIDIIRPNQVWATDITYIKLPTGFVYLVAILDVFSRRILSWRLSNSLSTIFCLEALNEALDTYGAPKIFNSDQGAQFTSDEWIYTLVNWGIQPSMTGVGRCLDNIHQERFWRTLKYENTYIYGYDDMVDARLKIGNFIEFYNHERPHQSLDYQTPDEVYRVDSLGRAKSDLAKRTILTLEELPSLGHNFKIKQNVKSELISLI
jgi:putative transposase